MTMQATSDVKPRTPATLSQDVEPISLRERGDIRGLDPQDVVMRALLKGGLSPGLMGSPYIKNLVNQMQIFAQLEDVMNLGLGGGVSELINSGGIYKAFDPGTFSNMAQKLLGMMAAGRSSDLGGMIGAAKTPTITDTDGRAGETAIGDYFSNQPTDEDMAQVKGTFPGFPGLESEYLSQVLGSPALARLLGRGLSFGRPGFGSILDSYISGTLYDTYRAMEPELVFDTDPITILLQKLGLGGQ